MAARSVSGQAALGDDMGKVFARVEIENLFDMALARAGHLRESEVRRIILPRVLVDSGATTLSLPSDTIDSLGLAFLEDVSVETATGITAARLFEGARVTVEGRTRPVSCLELPGGAAPLLG